MKLLYFPQCMRFVNLLMRAKNRGVFLDISKAFDKVWQEGLLQKLKENGISGKLLNTGKDFLYQQKQTIVLNGQYSSWATIEAWVPQGSIL